MKDGMKALTSAMAHVQAHRDHAEKVKGVLKDRAGQYTKSVIEQSKRLDASLGEVLSPEYDAEKRLQLTRERGILDNIVYND